MCFVCLTLVGSEHNDLNIESILNYETSQSFAGEIFILINDGDNDNESDSEEKNVESDSGELDFIYDEEIALVVEWTKRWFDKCVSATATISNLELFCSKIANKTVKLKVINNPLTQRHRSVRSDGTEAN